MMRRRLNVPATDVSLASVACSKALNLPAARALSRCRGAKVAIDALHGRTVKVLPNGRGVIKDRPLAFQARKKRASGPSGKSNWPKNRQEREAWYARRARPSSDRQTMDAALREAAKELGDDGRGAYVVRCVKEQVAILRLRQEAAAFLSVPPVDLKPSASFIAALAPVRVPSYTNGCGVVVADDDACGVLAGTAVQVAKGGLLYRFAQPGSHCTLVFHHRAACHD